MPPQTPEPEQSVSNAECDRRHGSVRWVLAGFMVVLSASVGFSYRAYDNAAATHTDMDEVKADVVGIQTALPYIQTGIDDIKMSQQRLSDKLDALH